ncbi:MAG: TetR/AcrR family transcriptional regulator [Myxococcales bacterium]|nr:TetR/AcrR family transcriptional regulator [Myxococcales bacterium]
MTGEREAAKQRTRRALVEAGIELFSEQGLDGPSLDAICERAGFTRGAFYVHFRDRDDFIVAVMEAAGPPILDELIAAEPGEALPQVFARFLSAFSDGRYPLAPRGGIRPHQLIDACVRSPRVRERYVELVVEAIRRVREGVAQGQRGGLLRDDVDPQAAATLLLAAIIGGQTMSELEVPYDFASTAAAMLGLLQPLGSGRVRSG